MVDLNRIAKAQSDLSESERLLRSLVALGKDEFLKDWKAALALRYVLIAAVEAITDICQHLLARVNHVACDGYVDCIVKAEEEGIITTSLAANLRRLADLRNHLVHRYWVVDDERRFDETMSNLDDIPSFLAQVVTYLDKSPER